MGGIYALISMGLSIQYGVAKILNIAHGEFIMIGACLTWALNMAGIHPLLALIICCPLILVVGFVLHRTLFKRLNDIAPSSVIFESNAMLLAFGLMYVLQNLATRIWGSNPLGITFLAYPTQIFGRSYATNRLLVLGFAAVISALFYLFLIKTRLGKSIRAASQDPIAAGLMGVKINTVMAVCFGIGAMLAGIAGVLLSLIDPIYTTYGMGKAVIAIIVVVLGGMGSVPGSIIGGVILGIVGTAVSTIEPSLTLVAFYLIIMVLLIVKPKGLLGR
ncbi:MAG: branched-chain amino acid ABC transporter permease [Oscillospiraceae bacterium]|jgi:branched-chain amino acid transport system permease protein|nr:branched-chain amino acid ABC transporter permease [Oscillospiraceae bacterium]